MNLHRWVLCINYGYIRKSCCGNGKIAEICKKNNVPIRIGKATVIPGDVVLAKPGAVLFIPAHLVEQIVLTSEFTKLTDEFGEAMIKEGRYTAGQIDSVWSDEMNKAFVSWVRNYPGKLPMSEKQLEACLKERNF